MRHSPDHAREADDDDCFYVSWKYPVNQNDFIIPSLSWAWPLNHTYQGNMFPLVIACLTHHLIPGLGVITSLTKTELFCHHCIYHIYTSLSQWILIFSTHFSHEWVGAHTNTDSPAWEMKPGCPSRLRTQELPCISVPFFIPESFSFLSLTSASGCFLLTCHGRGPESIKIHFSGYSLTSIMMGLSERRGDDC